MSIRFDRRTVVLGGTTMALAGQLPALAQEQGNQGQGTYWQPVLTRFYVMRPQEQPTFPEGDGPPVFPHPDIPPDTSVTPEVARQKGLLHFTLLPSPLDGPPTVDSDWILYDKLRNMDEHVSAIAMARDFGKPRLFMHRCRDEEYLATYPLNNRVLGVVAADIGREKFPIPDRPTGQARTDLIRREVVVTNGRINVSVMNKVKMNGAGGEVATELMNKGLDGYTLGGLGNDRLEIIPRAPTQVEGDFLNGVYRISVEMELRAGPSLGLAANETKKLSAELRFAIGDEYLDIRILGKK